MVGTATNAVGAAFGKGLDLVLLAVALRRIGAVAFGLVVVAQGLALWPTLLEKGVGQTMVRLVAGDRESESYRGALTAGVLFYALLGLLTAALGLTFARFAFVRVFDAPAALHRQTMLAVELLFLASAVRMGTGFVARVLVGRTSFARLRAVELARGATALACGLVLIGHRPAGLVGFAASLLAADLVAAALGVYFVRAERSAFHPRSVRREVLITHWREARPVLAASGIGLAWSRLDPVIIGVGLGAAAAATYGVAMAGFDMLQGLIEILYLGLLPTTASLLATGDGPRVGRLLAKANRYVTVIVWPVAATLAIFAPEIVRVWFRSEPPDVWPATALAMALIVTTTVPTCFIFVIVGAGRVGDVLRVQVWAAVVNLAISVGLLRPIGIGAVFLGSVVGGVLVAVRSSRVVADIIGGRRGDGWHGTAGPAALVVALVAAFGMLRLTGLGGVALGAAMVGLLGLYALNAVLWLVPRKDIRHLMPARR